MKNKLSLLIFILFFACSISDFRSKKDTNEIINFTYDYYFIEDDFIQFDIEYSIPYNKLIFTKDTSRFYASIITEMKILNKENEIIISDSWSDKIILDSFDIINSDLNHIFQYSFKINKHDSYFLDLTINDYSNHLVKNFSTSLLSSDYTYLSKINLYKKEGDLFKKINNNKISFIDTIWAKFQIIDNQLNENKFLIEIDNYENNKLFEVQNIETYQINYFPIPLDSTYIKKIDFKYRYKDVTQISSLYLTNSTYIDYDYSKLIVPITYILNKDQYLEYVDLDSIPKINYIIEYWETIQSNDFFEEFYSRIEYANKRFYSGLNQGHETDMGKIFIIYGPPKNIENRIDEYGKYEIWTYYDNKKFIFINRFGYYECYRC